MTKTIQDRYERRARFSRTEYAQHIEAETKALEKRINTPFYLRWVR